MRYRAVPLFLIFAFAIAARAAHGQGAIVPDPNATLAPAVNDKQSPGRPQASTRIDINTAPVKMLATLPGITTVLAAKIVDGRPYNATTDLKSKHIVGTAVFNRIETRITVAAPPPSSGAVKEWTGQVMSGVMAIGGETTGIVLTTAADRLELQPADQAMRKQLEELNGKTVTIRGTLDARPGVEVKTRGIIVVTEVLPKKLHM